MCAIFTPAIELKSTSARWLDVAVPPEAELRAPGRALARAISSLTDLAGIEG
jgi:hypothetical protein